VPLALLSLLVSLLGAQNLPPTAILVVGDRRDRAFAGMAGVPLVGVRHPWAGPPGHVAPDPRAAPPAPSAEAPPVQRLAVASANMVSLPAHLVRPQAPFVAPEAPRPESVADRGNEPITALPDFGGPAEVPAPSPQAPYAPQPQMPYPQQPPAPLIVAEDDDMTRTHLAPVGRVPGPPRKATDGWQLRLDDGRSIPVTGLVLIGRNPRPQPDEQAQLVQAGVESRMVSKTHLAVGRDHRGLYVMDRGSTNGTAIANSGGQFEPCAPGDPVRVREGQIVSFGDRYLEVRREPQ
jgi:FHA domain